jgi:NADH:ubiquinone oxidoreductase subunit 6 (subunit J)
MKEMHPISRSIRAMRATIVLTLFAMTVSSTDLAAQGKPVQTASQVPVALWLIGVVVLGLVIAYGIMRNRSRTRVEKQTTDEATKNLYAKEERDRAK